MPSPAGSPRRTAAGANAPVEKMDTPALDLLGLPDDLLSGALSRFCSAMALVSLAATCARLRGLCKQAAEVLLDEVGAAATTLAARIAGAATFRNLALLCGRAPLVTERFHDRVQNLVGTLFGRIHVVSGVVPIDWAALQLLFVAFGDVAQPQTIWDRAIGPTLSRALECAMVSYLPNDVCLRACHVLQALGIYDRSHASRIIDWRSKLQDLSGEDAPDDDPSPSANLDEHVSEPPEEFEDDVGVVIQNRWYGTWYGRKEDFFDLPDNFRADFPFPSSEEEDGTCEVEGCCHNASCWVEHGCMCMPARDVFDRARRLQVRNDSGSAEGIYFSSVDLAAHFVSSKLWRRTRTPCPAAVKKVEWLARHAAWRREGQADATATLAALGKRVVEGVPFGDAGLWGPVPVLSGAAWGTRYPGYPKSFQYGERGPSSMGPVTY